MNDVNLNSADLKLVSSNGRAQARALSSSQGEGRNASDLAPSSTGKPGETSLGPQKKQVSEAQKLEKRAELQRDQLDDAVSQLNDYVQNVQRDLQFEVDNERGETIVRVVDQQTQEVIRQIPDEVALRLAENLQQEEPLSLFNIKV